MNRFEMQKLEKSSPLFLSRGKDDAKKTEALNHTYAHRFSWPLKVALPFLLKADTILKQQGAFFLLGFQLV